MGADKNYQLEIENWRQEMEDTLKAEDGWLSISGLYWLQPGDNSFGKDKTNQIVLEGDYPALTGIFRMHERRVQVIPAGNTILLVNGDPVLNSSLLLSDVESNGKPDVVDLGNITMTIIERGDRIGVRIRDINSPYRKNFTHRSWFPVDPAYRVEAQYQAYPKSVVRNVPTVLDGVTEELEAVGTVTFRLHGTMHKLEVLRAEEKLWFVFRDKTAGHQTYGAARFLYADLPKKGKTVLDFNKAYNPPCAFNPYTTCPLPDKQNILPVEITAGELKYDH